MEKDNLVKPIVQWVGGKRQLLPIIKKFLPDNIEYYCEPFLGGGALFFDIQPTSGIVNDINKDLIEMYEVVKYDVDILIDLLRSYENTKEFYYFIRALDRDIDTYKCMSKIDRASRLIYLNKTCYRALFRVNKKGQFNSPYGYYKNVDIVNEETLRAVSKYLNNSDIQFYHEDYSLVFDKLPSNSFVYIDPPYDVPQTGTNSAWYVKDAFDRNEQIRLYENCKKLDSKGIKFMVSNYATDFIKDLYREYNITVVQSRPSIRSDITKGAMVDEVIIRNY